MPEGTPAASPMLAITTDPLFLAYVFVFGLAAVICAGLVPRARRIGAADTRRGLVALLLTVSAWAASTVGYLVADGSVAREAFYLIGLVVGFAAVGAWLYFASAYTGRVYHRHRRIRQAAVVVFVAIVAVKVTNPVHGYYYTATTATEPFDHLAIAHSTLHWTSMSLAYALAFLGIFLFFELFLQVRHDTRPLLVIVGLTAVPAVFDVGAHLHENLLEMAYSSLGVAVFAIGVLVLYEQRFEHVRVAGTSDEPVIVLDTDGRVIEHNAAAEELIPALSDARGDPVDTILPIDGSPAAVDAPVTIERDGEARQFDVTVTELQSGSVGLSMLLSLSDITHRERYRAELERQNDRLERFAGMVSHDLRNPISVARGHLELVTEDIDHASLDEVDQALARMEALIDDLLDLARHGRPIDETTPVDVCAVAADAWAFVDSGEAEFTCTVDTRLDADPDRLQQLFENLFRNAIEHGGPGVAVRVVALDGEAGFAVEDTGVGIDPAVRDDLFEPGVSTDADGTGFGMPIVKEIVDAHRWTIDVGESSAGGARFEIRT